MTNNTTKNESIYNDLQDVEMQIEDLQYEIYMCGDKEVNSGIASTQLM